jgi:hypothetical protein
MQLKAKYEHEEHMAQYKGSGEVDGIPKFIVSTKIKISWMILTLQD